RLAAARPGSRRAGLRWPRPRGGSPPSRCGPPGPRRRSTRRAWMGSRCARRAPPARARPRPSSRDQGPTTWGTTPAHFPEGGDPGDPMPDGGDAVVMREHVHYAGGAAELRAAVPPYQHVRSIGEDVSTAELLLPEGHRLRAVDVAAAAAAGATELLVRRRPVVA